MQWGTLEKRKGWYFDVFMSGVLTGLCLFMNTLTVALITLQIFKYDLSFSFRRLNFSFYRSFMELIESNWEENYCCLFWISRKLVDFLIWEIFIVNSWGQGLKLKNILFDITRTSNYSNVKLWTMRLTRIFE